MECRFVKRFILPLSRPNLCGTLLADVIFTRPATDLRVVKITDKTEVVFTEGEITLLGWRLFGLGCSHYTLVATPPFRSLFLKLVLWSCVQKGD